MLDFDGFDWDDGNWPKCGKHGVGKDEIEAVFGAPSLRVVEVAGTFPEARFAAMAMSPETGRWVFVVFTWRGRFVRPISARHMHVRDILRYVT